MDRDKGKYKEGFERGYKQLRIQDQKQAKADLSAVLKINNRNAFTNYLHGKTTIKVDLIEPIEAVFKQYGVSRDIWGKTEEYDRATI